MFFGVSQPAQAQIYAIKRAIKKGPDKSGIYVSFSGYHDGPSGYLLAEKAQEWLKNHNYLVIFSEGRMEYLEFVKKGTFKHGWDGITQLEQIGEFNPMHVEVHPNDLSQHYSYAIPIITNKNKYTLKPKIEFYKKLRRKYPKWHIPHLMLANLERRRDPPVMSAQYSNRLYENYLNNRFLNSNLINGFEDIDFGNIDDREALDKMSMQFYINSEIIYYMYSLIREKKKISEDEAFVKSYLINLEALEIQFRSLADNQLAAIDQNMQDRWMNYMQQMRKVLDKNNAGLVGLLATGIIYYETGKYLFKKGVEAGAFDSSPDVVQEKEINYSLGEWKKKSIVDSSVHDPEKISLTFTCNGIPYTEYLGRDLSKTLPYSAGTNVCDGFLSSKRFETLQEAIDNAIDCICD